MHKKMIKETEIETSENKNQIIDKIKNLEEIEKLARAACLFKNYDEAIDYCDIAIQKNPQLSWPHLIKSYSLYGMKRIKECKSEARIAFELDKESWEPSFWWGTVLCFFDKMLDEGIFYLEKAASLEKNNWFVFKNMSMAYAKKRNLKKYFEALGEMNRIKPSKKLSIFLSLEKMGVSKKFPFIYMFIYLLFITLSIVFGIRFLLWVPGLLTGFLLVLGISAIPIDRNAGIIGVLLSIISGLGILIAYRLI